MLSATHRAIENISSRARASLILLCGSRTGRVRSHPLSRKALFMGRISRRRFPDGTTLPLLSFFREYEELRVRRSSADRSSICVRHWLQVVLRRIKEYISGLLIASGGHNPTGVQSNPIHHTRCLCVHIEHTAIIARVVFACVNNGPF